LAEETEVLGEKLPLVPLCPPQIPHDLNRVRTWTAAVGTGLSYGTAYYYYYYYYHYYHYYYYYY
jgi:hypothetical protein